jgi:hypothetical protein
MMHHAPLAHGGRLRAAVPYTVVVLLLSPIVWRWCSC